MLSAKEVHTLAIVTALGRHHEAPKRELTDAELAARRIQDEQDGAMFITAAFAGLRLGELRALRWSDIDFELHVIHIRRAFTLQLEDVPKSGACARHRWSTKSRGRSKTSRAAGASPPIKTSSSPHPTATTWRTRRFAAATTRRANPGARLA
ncbi:MAG TPA: hypothetical protein VN892_18945 [Solirubrobacteraceae bacterium]|nr:hypothetical protein [Solirubrobacteraceae bacterium]